MLTLHIKTALYSQLYAIADLAQLVELLICNQWVGSSSLSVGTIEFSRVCEKFATLIFLSKYYKNTTNFKIFGIFKTAFSNILLESFYKITFFNQSQINIYDIPIIDFIIYAMKTGKQAFL